MSPALAGVFFTTESPGKPLFLAFPPFNPSFENGFTLFFYVVLSNQFFLYYVFYYFKGFPGGSAGKESTCNVGDLGMIPGLGRFPGERKGYPLQYSGLENSMDCIVLGVAKSQTQLSDFHYHKP